MDVDLSTSGIVPLLCQLIKVAYGEVRTAGSTGNRQSLKVCRFEVEVKHHLGLRVLPLVLKCNQSMWFSKISNLKVWTKVLSCNNSKILFETSCCNNKGCTSNPSASALEKRNLLLCTRAVDNYCWLLCVAQHLLFQSLESKTRFWPAFDMFIELRTKVRRVVAVVRISTEQQASGLSWADFFLSSSNFGKFRLQDFYIKTNLEKYLI